MRRILQRDTWTGDTAADQLLLSFETGGVTAGQQSLSRFAAQYGWPLLQLRTAQHSRNSSVAGHSAIGQTSRDAATHAFWLRYATETLITSGPLVHYSSCLRQRHTAGRLFSCLCGHHCQANMHVTAIKQLVTYRMIDSAVHSLSWIVRQPRPQCPLRFAGRPRGCRPCIHSVHMLYNLTCRLYTLNCCCLRLMLPAWC